MPTVRQESFFDPRCPYCREKIKHHASICPHCHSNLASNESFQAESTQKVNQGGIVALLIIVAFAAIILFFWLH